MAGALGTRLCPFYFHYPGNKKHATATAGECARQIMYGREICRPPQQDGTMRGCNSASFEDEGECNIAFRSGGLGILSAIVLTARSGGVMDISEKGTAAPPSPPTPSASPTATGRAARKGEDGIGDAARFVRLKYAGYGSSKV